MSVRRVCFGCRAYHLISSGNWDSIDFYRRSVGVSDTDEDDISVCPSVLDLRSVASSDAGDTDPSELEDEDDGTDEVHERSEEEEESELEEEDA